MKTATVGVDVNMEAKDVKTYPGTLYDYTAGVYCGVLITEKVMRKLVKLQAEHLESVRRLFSDNKDEVFPSMWTLHHPEGVQTTVHFIDTNRKVEDCIHNATVIHKPRVVFPAFIAGSMDEAKEMADARISAGSTP